MMKLHSLIAPLAMTSLVVFGAAACSETQGQGETAGTKAEQAASVAASPIVQSSGVSRIRAHAATRNEQGLEVRTIDLLDEAGQSIGTLGLTIEGQRVHAKATLRSHTLDATWTSNEIAFTHDSDARVSLHAGEKPSAAVDEILAASSDLLNVATYVAAYVGVASPVADADANATTNQLRTLDWGTGCSSERRYQGSSSTWSSSSSAVQQCIQSSAQAANQNCVPNAGINCSTSYPGTTTSTTVTPGTFFGYTCTTTIIMPWNCS